jgi:hypothetical protein
MSHKERRPTDARTPKSRFDASDGICVHITHRWVTPNDNQRYYVLRFSDWYSLLHLLSGGQGRICGDFRGMQKASSRPVRTTAMRTIVSNLVGEASLGMTPTEAARKTKKNR